LHLGAGPLHLSGAADCSMQSPADWPRPLGQGAKSPIRHAMTGLSSRF